MSYEYDLGFAGPRYDMGMDGILSDIWSGLKSAGAATAGAIQAHGHAQGQAAAAEAALKAQQGKSQTPAWLMPVLIGGGALALILILRKKK